MNKTFCSLPPNLAAEKKEIQKLHKHIHDFFFFPSHTRDPWNVVSEAPHKKKKKTDNQTLPK